LERFTCYTLPKHRIDFHVCLESWGSRIVIANDTKHTGFGLQDNEPFSFQWREWFVASQIEHIEPCITDVIESLAVSIGSISKRECITWKIPDPWYSIVVPLPALSLIDAAPHNPCARNDGVGIKELGEAPNHKFISITARSYSNRPQGCVLKSIRMPT
jgi:hypothetical protein